MLEHRFLLLSVFATFALLIIGGTVNPTGSSLACPEPTMVCHGQFFPELTGGVLYEHGHRLAAMTVGLLQIIATMLLWFRRRDLRWFGVLALVMVCAQGALGAVTVYLKLSWWVSTAHLATAFVYLALLLYLALRTHPRYRGPSPHSMAGWIRASAALVFAQSLLGGLMRHHGGAVACPDLPLCYGELVPQGLPLQLHMAHRALGIFAAVFVTAVAVVVWRRSRELPRLRLLALSVPFFCFCQVALGALTIVTLRSVPIAVGHFAGAVALYLVWTSMLLVTRRGA